MGEARVCDSGLESKAESETGWLSVSGSTNSGAVCPIRGAPLEAGSLPGLIKDDEAESAHN